MLAKYHRWVFESGTKESVVALKTWIFQESEFHTIASETTYGLTGNNENTQIIEQRHEPTWNGQTTFFGEIINIDSKESISCEVCGEGHTILNCSEFANMSVPIRWDTAKRLKLCYRCLAIGHRGKSCERSRPCGQGDCHKLHSTMLHTNSKRQSKGNVKRKCEYRLVDANNNSKSDVGPSNVIKCAADRHTFGTEGNRQGRRCSIRRMSHDRRAGTSDRTATEGFDTSQHALEGNHTTQFLG